MKESENIKICSICNKKILDTKNINSKMMKIFKDIFKDVELDEIIKKCYCDSNKCNVETEGNEYNIFAHKYCILLKIIFNFEIKCENCNSIYNIKIYKKIDKNKKLCIFITFLIIYISHLFIYLFCMFLLFINDIIKDLIISYKHIFTFFGVILFLINSLFLYFSIKNNIAKCKISIYKYSINICDMIKINNENELFKLMSEFYQWFYNQSIIHLLINKSKKFIINNIKNLNFKEIQKYIKKNNIISEIELERRTNKKLSIEPQDNKINDSKDKILFDNNNDNDNNNSVIKIKNILTLNNKSNKQEDNHLTTNKNINKSENNDDLTKKPSIVINESQNQIPKEYINININPINSKNINIKIRFSSDLNNRFDNSLSKEVKFKSTIKDNNIKDNKVGKSALIPKNLLMRNIISEANSFKRKKRLLKSIKLKQDKINLKLKGTKITGKIEEIAEVDFSEFDNMGSRISKFSKDKKTSLPRNDFDIKYSNFKTKKSYKDITLNISNSDIGGFEDEYNNENIKINAKNNSDRKRVHFAN